MKDNRHSYNGLLIKSCTRPPQGCHFEWQQQNSWIFSDMKHRAASLRQLSFLYSVERFRAMLDDNEMFATWRQTPSLPMTSSSKMYVYVYVEPRRATHTQTACMSWCRCSRPLSPVYISTFKDRRSTTVPLCREGPPAVIQASFYIIYDLPSVWYCNYSFLPGTTFEIFDAEKYRDHEI